MRDVEIIRTSLAPPELFVKYKTNHLLPLCHFFAVVQVARIKLGRCVLHSFTASSSQPEQARTAILDEANSLRFNREPLFGIAEDGVSEVGVGMNERRCAS